MALISTFDAAQARSFKRGETIYREGQPIKQLYLVQSGIVLIVCQRGDQTIEIGQVTAGHILGEEALAGATRWSHSAIVNNDVTAIPVETAQARVLLDNSAPLLKLFGRSALERQRRSSRELAQIEMDASDPTPCPPHRIAKLFAVLAHAGQYRAAPKAGKLAIVWPTFKKYCQRTFLESPVRLEQAALILVKLGYAELEYIACETDPNAPDELGFIHFLDLEIARTFSDYYRAVRRGESSSPIDPAHAAILKEIDLWNERGFVELPPENSHAA